MTTKQYLNQARYLDERINTKIDQVKSLHDLATKATSTLSDMPGSPTRNTHRMENIIVKILMLENAINADIECLVNLRDEINNTINSVEDEDCRLLLEKRYIINATNSRLNSFPFTVSSTCTISPLFTLRRSSRPIG